MPIYEYACRNCDREFNLLITSGKMTDQQSCPYCASEHLERKLSAFATPSSSLKACPAKTGNCGKYS
jgi:putative FmdB family regulatory protein